MPWIRVLGAVLAVLLAAGSVAAQDGTLPVTPGAGKYLPTAEKLGEGWVSTVAAGIAPGPQLFNEGVKGVYGGPAGSRAVVYVWITKEAMTADSPAWAAITDFAGSARTEWGSDFPLSREQELAKEAPPAGCKAAVRSEGIAAGTRFPVGLTLCAVAPDAIILTIVSGEYGGAQGAAAADALLATALQE